MQAVQQITERQTSRLARPAPPRLEDRASRMKQLVRVGLSSPLCNDFDAICQPKSRVVLLGKR